MHLESFDIEMDKGDRHFMRHVFTEWYNAWLAADIARNPDGIVRAAVRIDLGPVPAAPAAPAASLQTFYPAATAAAPTPTPYPRRGYYHGFCNYAAIMARSDWLVPPRDPVRPRVSQRLFHPTSWPALPAWPPQPDINRHPPQPGSLLSLAWPIRSAWQVSLRVEADTGGTPDFEYEHVDTDDDGYR